MKTLVYGFAFNGPKSYIQSAWNILDLFVFLVGVAVLVLDSFFSSNYILWLRALRAMR